MVPGRRSRIISNVQRAPTISSVRATGQDKSRLFFVICTIRSLCLEKATSGPTSLYLYSQYLLEMEPPLPRIMVSTGPGTHATEPHSDVSRIDCNLYPLGG